MYQEKYKTENRGGVRTSLTKKIGRPNKAPTTTIAVRVLLEYKDEIKERINKIIAEYK